jgi:hypothetical protein
MILVGLKTPSYATTTVGATRWLSVGVAGIEAFGAGYSAGTGIRNLYQSWQEDGKWEWKDAFNLINFIGIAAFSVGIRSAMKSSRAVNNLDANPRLQQAGETVQEIGDGAPPVNSTVPDKGNCFVAGTEILTSEGLKNIEDIQVGDWVIADDPTTEGEIEARQVTDTFVRYTDHLIDIYINEEVISVTSEHPFWTPDQGWIPAKDLQIGSLLQTEDGRIIDVDKLDYREEAATVYNFHVEGFHTYFVSELGVLVHNLSPEAAGPPIPRDENGRPIPLPNYPTGEPMPSSPYPHSQIGGTKGRKGEYAQTREWGENGQPIRRIDWTDHGRPNEHTNPHQHRFIPNPTGGTPRVGDAEPVSE